MLGLNCYVTGLIGTGDPRGLKGRCRDENAMPCEAVEVVATSVSVFSAAEMLSGSCCPVLQCLPLLSVTELSAPALWLACLKSLFYPAGDIHLLL